MTILENRRYAGAIYFAGYAVECLLKWAITRQRECVYLPPECETHDLDALLVEAGLQASLTKESELRAIFWALAENWGPELRYLAKAPEPNEARSLYRKILRVYDWIVEQRI